jgi:hypothetical protein
VRVDDVDGLVGCATAALPAGEWLWTVDLPSGTGDVWITLPDGTRWTLVAADRGRR